MSKNVKSNLNEKVLKLWHDESFPYAFTGLAQFQHGLKKIGIILSKRQLREILQEEPNYLGKNQW